MKQLHQHGADPDYWKPLSVLDGHILRTARKQHLCHGDGSRSHRHAENCVELIEPGERYVETFDATPAYQSGNRLTLACYRKWWLG